MVTKSLFTYIAKVISSNRKPAKNSKQLTKINCSPSLCVGSVYRVLWVLAGPSVAGDRCPTLLVFINFSCLTQLAGFSL